MMLSFKKFIGPEIVVVATLLLLIGLVGMMWTDRHRHDHFFQDMRAFAKKGGRNTATQGKELCERLNVIEESLNKTTKDCDAIYTTGGK